MFALDARALLLRNYDKPSRIFSCMLLLRNHMIFLVRSGINKHLQIFQRPQIANKQILLVFEKKLFVLIYSKLKSCDYLYKTNRFHVAVSLYNNRTQETSEYDKNVGDTLGYASFWCHLWSTAEQKHLDMEYTCS